MGRLGKVIASMGRLLVGARWLHDPLDRTRPVAVPLEPLGPWYYDMGRAIRRGDFHRFDSEGIPRLRVAGAGVVYHPSRVASFSLAHATRYVQTGEEADREAALRGARWLVANQVRDGPLAGAVPIPFDHRDLTAPWPSALTQGMALSALGRAFLMSGESAMTEAMARALEPFRRAPRDGGLRAPFRDAGDPWYEEYPHPGEGTHILNGFVYGLWGLRDAALLEIPAAGDLYGAGLDSLARHAEAYDLGYWTSYNRPDRTPPRVASLYYHQDHCVMMRVMHEVEGRPVFETLARRWEGYLRRFRCRMKVLTAKTGDFR